MSYALPGGSRVSYLKPNCYFVSERCYAFSRCEPEVEKVKLIVSEHADCCYSVRLGKTVGEQIRFH